MLFDVLSADESEAAPTAARKALLTRTSTFLMAANQLPLLGAGRVTQVSATDLARDADTCSQLPGFLAERCRLVRTNGETETAAKLDVVGFVDPGDLLGFRVSGGIRQETYPGVRFVTVNHRNAPQVLWAGTWPEGAHDRELHVESAASLFMCGARKLDGDRLEPRACGAR